MMLIAPHQPTEYTENQAPTFSGLLKDLGSLFLDAARNVASLGR
jgi:hypothetical protein